MPAKMPIYLKSTNSKKGKKFRLRDILSPDMISPPLGDFRHTIHIGKGGECDAFGDMSFLQGRFELLPGKGGIIRPQYGTHGEFTRANSASDASGVETPSPVLKNAISLPSIGGSQALTLPLISTAGFPVTQDPEPSTPPLAPDVKEDLEILQMEALLQSIRVFRNDPSPVPEEEEPLVKPLEMNEKSPAKRKNMESGENELETFLSVFVNGNSSSCQNVNNGNNHNNSDSVVQYKEEMFSIQGDWADRDSGVEEGRLCDLDFELSKSKSHSHESLTKITGSIFSLELDLGPSILDDVLNIMDKPTP